MRWKMVGETGFEPANLPVPGRALYQAELLSETRNTTPRSASRRRASRSCRSWSENGHALFIPTIHRLINSYSVEGTLPISRPLGCLYRGPPMRATFIFLLALCCAGAVHAQQQDQTATPPDQPKPAESQPSPPPSPKSDETHSTQGAQQKSFVDESIIA